VATGSLLVPRRACSDSMAWRPGTGALVVATVFVALVLAGPAWGTPTGVGGGTATVSVVSPAALAGADAPGDDSLTLRTTPGRFGTEATYLRIPDLVVDVREQSGRPQLIADLSVDADGIDPPPVSRILHRSGTHRLAYPDAALPPRGYDHGGTAVEPGTYDGHLEVRVQSFDGDHVVVNRSVEVVVGR